MAVMKLWHKITTDTTHAFTTVGIASLIGCQFFAIYHGKDFDAQSFGIALGCILGGAAAHSACKKEGAQQ